MRILLVDDEERFTETFRKILERRGARVLTASSGNEALFLIHEHEIDVVILDVKMPGMDGLMVLEEIKRANPLLEVLMLTGHATLDSALEGIKLGAFDYLIKPCEIDEVLAKAELAMEKKRLRENRSQRKEESF